MNLSSVVAVAVGAHKLLAGLKKSEERRRGKGGLRADILALKCESRIFRYCWDVQGWAQEMALSWEKVSARLQSATAGHARLVLSKTVIFSAQVCIRIKHFLFLIFKPVFDHWTGGETQINRSERLLTFNTSLLYIIILLSCFRARMSDWVTESSCSFLEKCHSLWLLGNDRADHDDVVDDIES